MDVTVAERTFTIDPVRVKDLPQFLAALEPVAREVASGDVLSAVAKHTSGMIEATAIGSGADRAWLGEQDMEALVALAAAVVQVNADFFVQRVMPHIEGAARFLTDRIAAATTPNGGTNG
jgi:hypothetical protein